MSTAAVHPPPSADAAPAEPIPLEAQIDQLLNEIGDAQREIGAILKDEDAALHPTPDDPDAPKADPAPAADVAPPPSEPPASPLEQSIDEAVEDAQQAMMEGESPSAAEEPPPPESVERIDDALAESADARMAEQAAEAPAAEPLPAAADKPPEQPSDESSTPPSVEPEGQVVPVVVSAPPEPLPSAPPPPESGVSSVEAKPGRGHATLGPRVAAVMAWPMTLLPPPARDLIGWLGLVTLFNAACIWIYVLTQA